MPDAAVRIAESYETERVPVGARQSPPEGRRWCDAPCSFAAESRADEMQSTGPSCFGVTIILPAI